MYQYYFSVAKDGKFLFRTDLFDERDRVIQVEAELASAYPADQGYEITLYKRKATWTSTRVRN